MAVAPERVGYDENVPGCRLSQSESSRFPSRMVDILAVNTRRVKEGRAGFFKGDPMLGLVTGCFLRVPFEHQLCIYQTRAMRKLAHYGRVSGQKRGTTISPVSNREAREVAPTCHEMERAGISSRRAI